MLENISWILKRENGGKLIFLAHNLHIARKPMIGGWENVGTLLGKTFGAKYYALGLSFYKGAFRAQDRDSGKSAVFQDSLLAIMRKQDMENLTAAKAIIAKHGWLSPQDVGMNASQGLFLIIQHADLKTQETYLPLIRTAEKQGKLLSSNLAILEDRIRMRKGLKQLYGSQGFSDKETVKKYFYPIEAPDGLDDRRKSMGLIPMQEHAKAMNIAWDREAYKSMLPEIERVAARQQR